jgi:hypothetical protein
MTDRPHIGETGRMQAESVEHAMLRAVGDWLGTSLEPRTLGLAGGIRVEVEGLDEAETVLVQLVPTSGPPKSHHRNKAMADMLKLVWLRSVLPSTPRAVLCISEPLARFFSAASWPSTAARDLGVDIVIYRPGAPAEHLV